MGRRYAVIIEPAGENWSAYVPDVDGCVTTGATAAETLRNIEAALAFHLEGMAQDGAEIPEPATVVDYIEVDVPANQPAGRTPRGGP